MRNSARGPIAVGICVVVASLFGAPSRGVAAGEDEQAKAFAPSAGKAAIYVYRARGTKLKSPVTVDGKRIGEIGNGVYFWLEVEPGEHEVWVGSDKGAGPHANITLIPISAAVGQSYFVRVEVTYAHDKNETVDTDTGKAELLACCKLLAAEQGASRVFN